MCSCDPLLSCVCVMHAFHIFITHTTLKSSLGFCDIAHSQCILEKALQIKNASMAAPSSPRFCVFILMVENEKKKRLKCRFMAFHCLRGQFAVEDLNSQPPESSIEMEMASSQLIRMFNMCKLTIFSFKTF